MSDAVGPHSGIRRAALAASSEPGTAAGGALDGQVEWNLVAELSKIVDLAVATVGAAHGASVSLMEGDHLTTVVASDAVVAGMDSDQYALGHGPCVSAAIVGEGFYIQAMSADTRWPAFASRAYRRGINSVISTPLIVEDRPVGALNVYSRQSRAFPLAAGDSAWALAARLAAVLVEFGGHDWSPAGRTVRPSDQLMTAAEMPQRGARQAFSDWWWSTPDD